MNKTIEQTLRDKFATGYDPVQLAVSARAINEENLEVTIEGISYSVRGDAILHLGGHRQRIGAAETAETATGASDSEGAGDTVATEEPPQPDSNVSDDLPPTGAGAETDQRGFDEETSSAN